MKILILGHGQAGKDVVATVLSYHYGLSFRSSSEAAFEEAIWPVMMNEYLPHDNKIRSISEEKKRCYYDRRTRREEWRKLILAYNTPDRTRLARKILSTCDVYVGLRSKEEFDACMEAGLFDMVLWIERPMNPREESMEIHFDPQLMIPIINVDTPDEKYATFILPQLIKIFGAPRELS